MWAWCSLNKPVKYFVLASSEFAAMNCAGVPKVGDKVPGKNYWVTERRIRQVAEGQWLITLEVSK